MLATQVVSRLRDAFQVDVPLRSLFDAPTISELSKLLEGLSAEAAAPRGPALVPISREARRRRLTSLSDGPEPNGGNRGR